MQLQVGACIIIIETLCDNSEIWAKGCSMGPKRTKSEPQRLCM
jgi:hypothetical protein